MPSSSYQQGALLFLISYPVLAVADLVEEEELVSDGRGSGHKSYLNWSCTLASTTLSICSESICSEWCQKLKKIHYTFFSALTPSLIYFFNLSYICHCKLGAKLHQSWMNIVLHAVKYLKVKVEVRKWKRCSVNSCYDYFSLSHNIKVRLSLNILTT